MYQYYLDAPAEVQAAIISAVGTLITTIFASIVAAVIGKQFANRKKIVERLHVALSDIEFLLAVEEHHCLEHMTTSDTSLKITMRNRARDMGLEWSARYSLSRIAALRRSLPQRKEIESNDGH